MVSTRFAPGRDVLRGIAQFAHEIDSWRLINVPGGDRDPIPDLLLDLEFDGIIGQINDHAMAEVIRARDIPVVDVLSGLPDTGFPQVDIDEEAVAGLAAEHFFDRGFHHVAFYPFENNREAWSRTRCESLRKLCSGRASFHTYRHPWINAKAPNPIVIM